MAVVFAVFGQFRFVVNTWISDDKGNGSTRDVCLDIADTCDLGQSASDRSGTGTSVHVRYIEAYERRVTRCFRRLDVCNGRRSRGGRLICNRHV